MPCAARHARGMEDTWPLTRRELVASGIAPRDIRGAVESGTLVRVRRGSYVAEPTWRDAFAEARELTLAQAAAQHSPDRRTFSHTTAAALHGLPLVRHHPDRAHVMVGSESTSGANRAIFRHRDEWDGVRTSIDGLSVTTLARTVYDVVRTSAPETAITVADAALRKAGGGDSRDIDEHAAEALRSEVLDLIARSPGRRGVIQAREIMSIADAGADSPGESISRLYLVQLGFCDIEVQVRVPSPHGGSYCVDLGFAGVLGEFDGHQKYSDPAMLDGRTPEQALVAEKEREDWIRGTTGRRVIRWTMRDIRSLHAFRRFLHRLGVPLATRRNGPRDPLHP